MGEGEVSYGVVVRQTGDRRLQLRVSGELDMAVAPHLLDSILCAGLAGPCREVTIDLSEVTFIDSSGLGALLEARRRLASEGCQLTVRGLAPRIRQLLDRSGLTGCFGLDLDASDAVRSRDEA